MLLRSIILAILVVLLGVQNALCEDRKWTGYVETGGKLGNQRNIINGKFLIPIRQNHNSMIFLDLRMRGDSNNSKETNFGLGYRKIIGGNAKDSEAKIIGTYAFFDKLTSVNNNVFKQLTWGVEMLTTNWDLRTNFYIPENKEALVEDSATLIFSGGEIGLKVQREHPMRGFDLEAGYKIPFLFRDFRIFAGGYHFEYSGYEDISGPRARAEYRIDHNDIRRLPKELEIKFGTEFQYDHVRGENYFVGINLKYSLTGANSYSHLDLEKRDLTGISKRMEEFVVRDIDIVTNTEFPDAAEAVMIGNAEVSKYEILDSSNDIKAKIEAGGNNKLFIIDGSAGTITTIAKTTLSSGQAVVGAGKAISITGASSGVTVSNTISGSRPTISGIAFDMSNNSHLQNIDFTNISNHSDKIQINDVSNVSLSDLSLGGSDAGIYIKNSLGTVDNITIKNTDISFTANGFGAIALSVDNTSGTQFSTNLTIDNVAIIGPTNSLFGIVAENNAAGSVNIAINNSSISDVKIGVWAIETNASNSFNLSIDDTTINNINGTNAKAFYFTGVDALTGSNNTLTNITGTNCTTSNIGSSSLSYNNGITCP